jgi:hypothetical protein
MWSEAKNSRQPDSCMSSKDHNIPISAMVKTVAEGNKNMFKALVKVFIAMLTHLADAPRYGEEGPKGQQPGYS